MSRTGPTLNPTLSESKTSRMTLSDACCTCATLLTDTKVPYDPDSEKPLVLDRKLDCCGRTICATCQYKNPRFQTYCPFCQISSEPSALPSTGLRLPPSYTSTNKRDAMDLPPSYESVSSRPASSAHVIYPPADTPDTVHFLSMDETINSLSLAYKVPAAVLRQHNGLYSDSLLAARKFLLIPHTHYTGPALSTPPDPDEEERKNKVRRWMVATKCAEYNVATLYLKGSDWNLDIAIGSFKADEQWEKDHPLKGKGKDSDMGKRKRFGGSSLAGQLQ